jgi:hypothetical protein
LRRRKCCFPCRPSRSKKLQEKFPEIKKLRKAELAAYKNVAEANAELNAATNANAPAPQLAQAQSKLDAAVDTFKQAHTALENKVYVLDK